MTLIALMRLASLRSARSVSLAKLTRLGRQPSPRPAQIRQKLAAEKDAAKLKQSLAQLEARSENVPAEMKPFLQLQKKLIQQRLKELEAK